MQSFSLLCKFSYGNWSLPNRYCTTLETCIQIATWEKMWDGVTKRIATILGREIGFNSPKLEREVVYTGKQLNYFPSETALSQKFHLIPLQLQAFLFSGWVPGL